MTLTVDYCETVLPELAYLVSLHQPAGQPLNTVANLASYFERDTVLAHGREIHAARTTPDSGPNASANQLQVAGQLIADCHRAFSARSSAEQEVTALYFSAPTGIAEILLVAEEVWVTTHPADSDIMGLLVRHLRDMSALILLMRQDIGGDRCYLAFSGTHRAYSPDGTEWSSGDDEDADRVAAAEAFVR